MFSITHVGPVDLPDTPAFCYGQVGNVLLVGAPSRNGLGGAAALFLSSMGGILWAAGGLQLRLLAGGSFSSGQMQESPKLLQEAWLPSSPSQG